MDKYKHIGKISVDGLPVVAIWWHPYHNGTITVVVWQASSIQSLPGGNVFLQLLKEVFLHVSTVGVSRGSVRQASIIQSLPGGNVFL